MKLSTMFSVNWQDAFKGLVVAVVTTAISSLYMIISAGEMPTTTQWKYIGLTSLSAGLAYLSKNFFTPAPKVIQIDPTKTAVVDKDTKEVITDATIPISTP